MKENNPKLVKIWFKNLVNQNSVAGEDEKNSASEANRVPGETALGYVSTPCLSLYNPRRVSPQSLFFVPRTRRLKSRRVNLRTTVDLNSHDRHDILVMSAFL